MQNTTTMAKDPVCGMDVDPAAAPAKSEHKGETYYFCSMSCKETFDASPDQYVADAKATDQSGSAPN